MIESILQRLNAIPADKVMHFASGVILFASIQWISVPLACAAVVLAGLGKELYDMTRKDIHTPDIWDAVATILGGAVGLSIKLF